MTTHGDERLLLVVVGASIDAERHDRAHAGRVRDAIITLQKSLNPSQPLDIVTCTDVWYLNDSSLTEHPVISIGRPEANAATAFLASRIPTAMVMDHAYRIHVDPEFVQLRACLWRASPTTTKAAVDVFEKRYLESFLRAVHDLAVDVG